MKKRRPVKIDITRMKGSNDTFYPTITVKGKIGMYRWFQGQKCQIETYMTENQLTDICLEVKYDPQTRKHHVKYDYYDPIELGHNILLYDAVKIIIDRIIADRKNT